MKKGLFSVLSLILIVSCSVDTTVHNDFQKRIRAVSNNAYFEVFTQKLTKEQRRALEFLYAYMPLPDLTDYDGGFYKENVDYALLAKREMPWGARVPAREFQHFVLPVRVNNENLDDSRKLFYEALKARVGHLTMRDAVLEINHWCHEQVSYRPSDSRTSSPLATVRTAYGRCGEESTFLVAALRAVAIPARQVYTPRWAHTDSNHAWVEAWVDGEWCFLGACEPEPVLNLGWFNAPASRGMLMHTRVFGRYAGDEEVMNEDDCYTEINVTRNYAPVSTMTITVVDNDERPMAGIPVEFKLYNYGELYTVARKVSDAEGRVSITAGKGDMMLWASDTIRYGIAKVTFGGQATDTLKLEHDLRTRFELDVDIVPPKGSDSLPTLSDQQRQLNFQRLAYEDSLRNAYEATFFTLETARDYATRWQGIEPSAVAGLLVASRGNHAALTAFIEQAADKQKAVELLQAISEKDLRDVPSEVLFDHYTHFSIPDGVEPDICRKYLFSPRVANEWLTPYRAFFQNAFAAEAEAFKANPLLLVEWCGHNITISSAWNPQKLRMAPRSVYHYRTTDSDSRAIFFVAAARSLGIPARINEIYGSLQYFHDKQWQDVVFNKAETAPPALAKGGIRLDFAQQYHTDDPQYYSHFSLSKVDNGQLNLLTFPSGTTYKSLTKNDLNFEVGHYLLVTGTRLASGGVLAHLDFFTNKPDAETTIPLTMRESRDELQVIGNFNSENKYYNVKEQKVVSLLETAGRGYYIIGLISPNSEPTNHALRDISNKRRELEQWGRKIILLFDDTAAQKRFKAAEFDNLPNTVEWGIDIDHAIGHEIAAAMKIKGSTRPVFLICDSFNRVVYLVEGYSIGLGEQFIKVRHKF